MTKKVVLANIISQSVFILLSSLQVCLMCCGMSFYNCGDSIHAIDHTHHLPTRGHNGQQVLSRSDGLRLPCLLRHMASFSKQYFTGSEGSSTPFFGKVPHSSFFAWPHVHQHRRPHFCNYDASAFASGQKFWQAKIWQSSIHSPKFTPSNIFCMLAHW